MESIIAKNLLRGALSLISPMNIPSRKSEEEIEELVWTGVGSCLRDALNDYEQTEEYKAAVTEKQAAQRP